GTHGFMWSTDQQRQVRVQTTNALSRVTRGGESYDCLGVQTPGNSTRRVGNNATRAASNMRQRWHTASALCRPHDARPGARPVARVNAHRTLTREHNGISTIEYRFRDIRCLRASWAGVFNHGIQHLGCHDDGLRILASNLHGTLLYQWNLLQWDLNAQVTTSNHDGVEGQDDGFKRVNCFRLLQLRDDRNATAFLIHNRVNQVNISRRTHERQSDKVYAQLQSKAQVRDILLTQRWDGNRHAW